MKRMVDDKLINEFNSKLTDGFSGDNASTKKIYWHTIKFQRGGTPDTEEYLRFYGNMIIINNSPAPLTADDFVNLLKTPGFYGVILNGKYDSTGASDLSGMTLPAVALQYSSEGYYQIVFRNAGNVLTVQTLTASLTGISDFEDLGVNPLN